MPGSFLDALAEASFERTPDGRLIFFGWFGRGYEVSERTGRTLRREGRLGLALVCFGYPLASLAAGSVGAFPVMAFVALTGLAANLRIAWLLRGAPRTAHHRSARESRERTAAALSHRAIWGITLAFLALASAALGISVVEEEPVFIAPALVSVALAAWIGGGLFRLKRRAERGPR